MQRAHSPLHENNKICKELIFLDKKIINYKIMQRAQSPLQENIKL